MALLYRLLTIASLILSTSQVYMNLDDELNTTAGADYKDAFGNELINVAYRKKVTLDNGEHCPVGPLSILVFIGQYLTGTEIESTTITDGATYIIRCKKECYTSSSNVSEVTPPNSKASLQAGENAVIDDLIRSTYLITVLANSVSEGEISFLTASVTEGSASENVLLKMKVSADGKAGDLMVQRQNTTIFTELDINGLNHIVIMASAEPGAQGVSFLVNGNVVYSLPQTNLTGLTMTPPTSVYDYEIQQWKVFDSLVNTHLYQITNGEELAVHPSPTCNCPDDYPIFQRWPLLREDGWRGINCQSVGGDQTTSRINLDSYQPQFITDGNLFSYWLSGEGIQNKLTIDLATSYQIFYAKLTLLTLPKHLVLTKTVKGSTGEDVLFVITDDCSASLPSSLPQGMPLTCQSYTLLYNSEEGEDSKTILLDWTSKILNPDNIIKNSTAFYHSLSDGTFEAQSVSLYLNGFEGRTDSDLRHAISELTVSGSCGCSNGAACVVNPSAINRRTRAAEIPLPPPTTVDTSFTFEQMAGFRCDCPSGYKGNICDECTDTSYNVLGECIPCNCGDGSVNEFCDNRGKCECKTDGAGAMSELADNKCHPFVHSVVPAYGPVDGGTNILVEGGWLDNVQHVNIGSGKCYKQLNVSSNETQFYCLTESSPKGLSEVFTDDTTALTNFTFKANPNITAIGRVEVFTRGGVEISVSGTNLDSVAEPKIVVTVICRSSQEKVAATQGDCDVQSPEEMTCNSPDLTGLIQKARCAAITKRRKRATDVNSLFEFNLGIKLDGVDDFETASESPWLAENSRLFVRPDPKIFQFDDAQRIYRLNGSDVQLEIKGENLNSGASLEDYTVTIGVGTCESAFLYHNLLKCNLPSPFPEAGDDYISNPEDPDKKLPSVLVKVGNIVTHVGYVMEYEVPASNKAPTIALPTTACVIALVIIAISGVVGP